MSRSEVGGLGRNQPTGPFPLQATSCLEPRRTSCTRGRDHVGALDVVCRTNEGLALPMAPRPESEAAHLRDKARKDLLSLLEGVSNSRKLDWFGFGYTALNLDRCEGRKTW
jgi:hypothetical protein